LDIPDKLQNCNLTVKHKSSIFLYIVPAH